MELCLTGPVPRSRPNFAHNANEALRHADEVSPTATWMKVTKGSLVAPLFFAALGIACFASQLGTALPWALATLALVMVGWAGTEGRAGTSPIALATLSYATWVALSALALSPAYTSAGLYHPALLISSFLVMRRLTAGAERWAAISIMALGALLASWGLAQVAWLGMARAHAMLETPATYATVLNLVLVPMVALAAAGHRSTPVLASIVVVSAGLFAADSRGGLLGLAAGIACAVLVASRTKLLKRRHLALALALVAVGAMLVAALRVLPSSQQTERPTATERSESSLSRLELFALALDAWRARPWLGHGYLTYEYAFEKGRAGVPSYQKTQATSFVHNDYLQTLSELGLIGVAAFLAFVWLPLWMAYRRIQSVETQHQLAVVACASALASMAIHALVDFPFYVPICLVMYGAFLGALEKRVCTLERANTNLPGYAGRGFQAIRAGASMVALVLLLRPVSAEYLAERGLRDAAVGKGQRAALMLGMAQSIEPADWRYHWYAGQFWDAQAVDSGRREAAQLAAKAYAAGLTANPLEVRNLLGMISVHRRHRNLLDEPADAETLQRWQAQATALAPLNPAVRRELAQ